MSFDLNFRNAYLVLAHEDVAMLNLLTKRLINTGYVYIHIDLKSRITVQQVLKHPKVRVTKQIKVNWGGFSIVEATRLLAGQALQDGATRLTLLSGLSYPIASDDQLISKLQAESDYIDAIEVDFIDIPNSFIQRFISKHFSFHLQQGIPGRIIRRLSREFWRRMPRIDPFTELGPIRLIIGSQRWSVKASTYRAGIYLADASPNVLKYFRKIECSDESFFGIVFHHVSENYIRAGTTYVSWGKGGNVQPLNLYEFRKQAHLGQFLFVRKMRSSDFHSLGLTQS